MGIKGIFDKLKESILYLEVFVYVCVFFLIIRTLLRSAYDFIKDKDMNTWYEDSKLDFSYTISISLTSILLLEVLKLFYLKTYKQIFIVTGIIALKITINYFVERDLKELQELKKKH